MADIQLRYHKDMLVLTTPILPILENQGTDTTHDLEMIMLVEPEELEDAYRMEVASQAPVLVAQTTELLPACLLHKKMEARYADLVNIAMELATAQKTQHVLVSLGPTGLPFDASSKTILKEHRDQYARAARAFEPYAFDAYLLEGFEDVDTLRCALMGLRMVTDRQIFASVKVNGQGLLRSGATIEQAAAVMLEYEASVMGFSTPVDASQAAELAKRMLACGNLPLLVQLEVGQRNNRQLYPTQENPYYRPDTLFDAIAPLRSAGAQFIQATGAATPAYAGALAAVLNGLDVIDVRGVLED